MDAPILLDTGAAIWVLLDYAEAGHIQALVC
jgi:hypothetical protein